MSTLPSLNIRVGTASWSEPEFVKAGWYPKGLEAGQRLPYYAQQFDMVELNSSFYAIPAARMCERWVKETPDGFLFDVKCHRLLSRHATKEDALPKDLRDAAETTDRSNVILTPVLEEEVAGRFLAELAPLELAGKLGALLLQMTPGFAPRTANLTALEPLLRQLKGSGKQPRRVVLELRHHDWLDSRHREQTTAFLRELGVTLASIDGPPADAKHFTIMPALDEITEPRLAYLRLHGRDAKAYLTGKTVAERFHYDYGDTELDEVAGRAQDLARQVDQVHVVFNNNTRDFAPRAAERLRQRLGQLQRRLPRPAKQGTLLQWGRCPSGVDASILAATLFDVAADEFGHLEHAHLRLAVEHRLELVVRVDLRLLGRVLELVLADVFPQLFGQFGARQRFGADYGCQRLIWLHWLGEASVRFLGGWFLIGRGGYFGHGAVSRARTLPPAKCRPQLHGHFSLGVSTAPFKVDDWGKFR